MPLTGLVLMTSWPVEGEDRDAEEEANAATLEEEDAPHSEAQPIPHHVLHVPVISHTPASPHWGNAPVLMGGI